MIFLNMFIILITSNQIIIMSIASKMKDLYTAASDIYPTYCWQVSVTGPSIKVKFSSIYLNLVESSVHSPSFFLGVKSSIFITIQHIQGKNFPKSWELHFIVSPDIFEKWHSEFEEHYLTPLKFRHIPEGHSEQLEQVIATELPIGHCDP